VEQANEGCGLVGWPAGDEGGRASWGLEANDQKQSENRGRSERDWLEEAEK